MHNRSSVVACGGALSMLCVIRRSALRASRLRTAREDIPTAVAQTVKTYKKPTIKISDRFLIDENKGWAWSIDG